MYSELSLRLEPVGLERVAAAVRAAGHEVRLLDLQIFTHDDYWCLLAEFKPQAVGFSLNYLARAPRPRSSTTSTSSCPLATSRRGVTSTSSARSTRAPRRS